MSLPLKTGSQHVTSLILHRPDEEFKNNLQASHVTVYVASFKL